ncbi:hypothetical protein DA01_07895 [Dehalococcoides mccartyi]|uniref:Uncharacterized protein n=1 Tax=Dehalococcoides mccartyi TaxID=61435 RepID=A0A0V8M5Q3_9CHLR|nr:hypothetical protein [Dehalococcoides mccartyi]KSV18889.1 hypothetical protein DA01_07895 [Dehalococcoides mccartyi]
MLKIVKNLNSDSIDDPKLTDWLDEQFQVNLLEESDYQRNLLSIQSADWGSRFLQNTPESLADSFFYISKHTTNFGYQNYTGRICQKYIWPLFFKKFPLGKILLVKISDNWWGKNWQNEEFLNKDMGLNVTNETSQGFSGLLTQNFPFTALDFIASGAYPLTLFTSEHTVSDLIMIYIPDKAFKHSQMSAGNTLYQNILWRLHHIYDDQWTFDSSRGHKSSANDEILNPLKLHGYFEWTINLLDHRMKDLLEINDTFKQIQIGMTINRAMCDALLSITSELPYISKTFFFSCLDKLANFSLLIGYTKTEPQFWKDYFEPNFLDQIKKGLKMSTNPMSDHINWIIEQSIDNLRVDGISGQDLKDLRNSCHGYYLNNKTTLRLFKKTGELNNDITLVLLPFILYFLTREWRFTNK